MNSVTKEMLDDYSNHKINLTEVAGKLNCSPPTAKRLLYDAGYIPYTRNGGGNSPLWGQKVPKNVLNAYSTKLITLQQVADILGCSRATAFYRLRASGHKPRDYTKRKNIHNFVITEDQWIRFMNGELSQFGLAKEVGCSRAQVLLIVRARTNYDAKEHRKLMMRRLNSKHVNLRKQIVSEYNSGIPALDIAKNRHISKQRVYQIIKMEQAKRPKLSNGMVILKCSCGGLVGVTNTHGVTGVMCSTCVVQNMNESLKDT